MQSVIRRWRLMVIKWLFLKGNQSISRHTRRVASHKASTSSTAKINAGFATCSSWNFDHVASMILSAYRQNRVVIWTYISYDRTGVQWHLFYDATQYSCGAWRHFWKQAYWSVISFRIFFGKILRKPCFIPHPKRNPFRINSATAFCTKPNEISINAWMVYICIHLIGWSQSYM